MDPALEEARDTSLPADDNFTAMNYMRSVSNDNVEWEMPIPKC